MLRTLGADLVGMSTVLEAIAARAEGVEVFALSLVTNLAAGLSGAPLDHHEVLEAGAAAAARMGALLRRPGDARMIQLRCGRAVTALTPTQRDAAMRWIADDPDPDTRVELQRVLAAALTGDRDAAADLADRMAGTAAVRHGRAARAGPAPARTG